MKLFFRYHGHHGCNLNRGVKNQYLPAFNCIIKTILLYFRFLESYQTLYQYDQNGLFAQLKIVINRGTCNKLEQKMVAWTGFASMQML